MKRSVTERAAAAEARAKRLRAEAKAAENDTVRALLRAHDLIDGAIADGPAPVVVPQLTAARLAVREALNVLGAPLP